MCIRDRWRPPLPGSRAALRPRLRGSLPLLWPRGAPPAKRNRPGQRARHAAGRRADRKDLAASAAAAEAVSSAAAAAVAAL
eukprot:13172115-Alexandrium_andersonii.AAC.1